MTARTTEQPDEALAFSLAPASMPPPTCLLKGKEAEALHAVALKDPSLKMYHVMSVKQTLREDLAECAHQFSCRAADWSRSDIHAVPMQFEPLELHVIDALGQQEVPDYFQQPAKAIEDVSVMKGQEGQATSPPLPARLILVTKPNIHGGPARKKARIVICGNFQDVHPDEFTASKTPSYPALRMALSVASHMGWPMECWDVSTAFLYARLIGDRDTDLGGNEVPFTSRVKHRNGGILTIGPPRLCVLGLKALRLGLKACKEATSIASFNLLPSKNDLENKRHTKCETN